MTTTPEQALTSGKLCPLREKPCVGDACQWWVPDTGDPEYGGDCAMLYLALKKEPKWQYAGPKAGRPRA